MGNNVAKWLGQREVVDGFVRGRDTFVSLPGSARYTTMARKSLTSL